MIPAIKKQYEPSTEEKEEDRLDIEILKKARTHDEYLRMCREKAEMS